MPIKYNEGDIVGDFGVRMVKRLYKKSPRTWYAEFECPYCHNIFIARINDVSSNRTKSCGCLHREQAKINGRKAKISLMHNLQGQRFGYLEVVEEADEKYRKKYRNGIVWKCFCHLCNRECYMSQESLHKGAQSCGCLVSKGEERIASLLQELDIFFVPQYSPEDLVNIFTNRRFRFDFYIPSYSTILEYDGIQHYKISGWNTKEKFFQIQQYDEIKNNYCKRNGLRLIRIPYTDYNKIDKEYILDLLQSDGKEFQ